MTIQVDNALPPNVVEIGNEITQGVVDGLMSASPAPSSANPYATIGNLSFLPLAGGIIGDQVGNGEKITFTAGGIILTNEDGDYNNTGIGRGGISFHDDGTGNTASYNANGISVNSNKFYLDANNIGGVEESNDYPWSFGQGGAVFIDGTIQTTAAVSPDLSGYLTKADNLNSVANKSTARTNLGLSSLATASFATNAESNKGTSASVALTPANALWTAMSPALHATTTFSVNNLSTGGTGGTTAGGDLGVRIFTGTTAASYGAVRNGALTSFPTSRGTSSAIDWSKIIIISGTNLITPLNSVATNRFLFGTTNTGQVADLANRGIGMRQIGTGAVELQVHNGTTLTNVTSSFTPTNNTAFDFMIYSDGVGNATLYINDSAVATSASAPTVAGASTQNYIGVGSEISANVASQTFYGFGNIKTYLGR
ncbi:hypothetical protein UFOVP144_54 [uncultured Caudovirales phage]|uniref:Uncharacterized protein n=1 Tax=uncultured Caudovirales phage TaxID=2100421 RepID=A0A6J7XMD0_9CAUD|nr:hypothetical protein UFOVP144_54 [uncultured Caudovirales phage]